MLNGQMRVGIYGGTFAPPHNGHVAAARAFLEAMELDLLYIIPAGIPPHKQVEPGDDPVHRCRMCELAFAGDARMLVSDMEIARKGPSYTVDTLRALARPDRRLFLLLGTDMMLTLGDWHESAEIFRLCYPVYIRRERDPLLEARIVARNRAYLAAYGRVVRRLQADPIVISSSEVRARVRRGESVADVVPPAVASYIREHRLYV